MSAWGQQSASHNSRAQAGFGHTVRSPDKAVAEVQDMSLPVPDGKGSTCSQASTDHVVSVDLRINFFLSQCPCAGSSLSPVSTVLFVLINIFLPPSSLNNPGHLQSGDRAEKPLSLPFVYTLSPLLSLTSCRKYCQKDSLFCLSEITHGCLWP